MKDSDNIKAKIYREYLKGKRVDVLGAGISNSPLIAFLTDCNAAVTVRDKKPKEKLDKSLSEFEKKGVKFVCGEDYLENLDGEIIFRTPGIRFDVPQIVRAIERGAIITSEMEAFISICPCKIIAITGSDGKSTTSTLTAKILEEEGFKVHLGGNIGRPLLAEIDNISKDDFAVIELSSFQLHTINRFKNEGLPFAHLTFPNASVITNVSPNHLNWHTDMDEYSQSKAAVFENMNCGARFVTNIDYPICEDFAVKAKQQNLDVVKFSSKRALDDGLFLRRNKFDENDYVIIRKKSVGSSVTEKIILTKEEILLRGIHNAENYMAAVALTENYLSENSSAVKKVASSFGGVRHRLELCRVKDGVCFYNSSIDSSPSRTLAALSTFPEKSAESSLVLVMGGADKNIPFDGIGKEIIKKAKAVFLSGPTSEKIKSAIISEPSFKTDKIEIVCCENFDSAVKGAANAAVSKDNVLLSPACTSFDAFNNFEERGNRFKEIVNSL